MERVYQYCCGLDVHKRSVTACVLTPKAKELRSFGTTTKELLALADWLVSLQVTHVAMESAGVYWKPVYNILEAFEFELLLCNARHIKAVPGRKTDVKDAEWIAELLRHGLLKGSFVPSKPQRELRELTRHRRSLLRERARTANRLQKLLEGANIKLGNVLSDISGVSGLAMLKAMAAGESDPERLAELARGRLKAKHGELVEALTGALDDHQRFLIGSYLRLTESLSEEIARLDAEVEARLAPFAEALARLDEIPGVGLRVTESVAAELGLDMSRFPTAACAASWAKLCPGNHESAGKRRNYWIGHGNRWLRETLIEAAWAAVRTKGSYFQAQYRRLAARRGKKRAIIAVAHSLLVVIYHMLRDGTTYQALSPNHFDERNQEATIRGAVRRIERLGYRVTLEAV